MPDGHYHIKIAKYVFHARCHGPAMRISWDSQSEHLYRQNEGFATENRMPVSGVMKTRVCHLPNGAMTGAAALTSYYVGAIGSAF